MNLSGRAMAEREAAQKAFRDGAMPVMNARQAEALAALLWDGELTGTRCAKVEPPRVAMVIPLGQRDAMNLPVSRMDRRTREYATEPYPDGRTTAEIIVEDPPFPASHTIGVLAEDGRSWSIVRGGICWPVEPPLEGHPMQEEPER